MLQAYLLRCKPRARFHFGKVAPDNNTSLNATSEWLHSDTLFSALVNTLADLYPPTKVDDLVQHFRDGDIRLSSAFYCLLEKEKPIFFLPKPSHYRSASKTLNRVKFISKAVWETGAKPEDWVDPVKYVFLQNGDVVAARDEIAEKSPMKARKINLYKEADAPRVKVHAVDQQDAFFYLTYIAIADNSELSSDYSAHFYFLIETSNDFEKSEDYQKILRALHLLPVQGIGGERAAGCGQFKGLEKIDFVPPQNQGGFCTLSLALPKEGELAQFEDYQVLTRGGRNFGSETTQKYLNFVRMLAEGAFSKTRITGDIANISGPAANEVYLRYGMPIQLPVNA